MIKMQTYTNSAKLKGIKSMSEMFNSERLLCFFLKLNGLIKK